MKKNKLDLHGIQAKRQSSKKSGFRIFHARTSGKRKNKRRSLKAFVGTAEGELGEEVPKLGVTRALLIILALHVVIILAIVYNARSTTNKSAAQGVGSDFSHGNEPSKGFSYLTVESDLSSQEEDTAYHFVKMGDTYERISASHGVDEQSLRKMNRNRALRSGDILRLPEKQTRPQQKAELERLKKGARQSKKTEQTILVKPKVHYDKSPSTPVPYDKLYPVVEDEAATAPRVARPQKPKQIGSSVPKAKANSKINSTPVRYYTVRSGDSIWRISKTYKVSQKSLLNANGNLDPRKLRVGMKLVIPAH